MKNSITVFTKILLDLMFYAGIIVTLTVPLSFRIYSRYNSFFDQYYIFLCIVFMLSGVFAILTIKELRNLLRSVLNDDCFIRKNVDSLRKMGTYSFLIAVTTIARCYVYLSPAVFITILVFVIAGLFSKVLAHVFDKAVTYKLENDLTI